MRGKAKPMRYIIILLVSVLISGCSPTPAPSLVPPSSPTTTHTPVPSPTATTTPTPTVAPPQVSINHLENPIVTKLHTFETETSDWNFELSSIQNGELLLTAAEEGNSVFLNRQFEEGEGIIFLYKNDEGRDWASFFANGAEYRSQPFLNFGIYDLGYPKLDIIKGPNGFRENNIQGNFSPRLNTWYQVLMAIGENGHFLVTISDPQNPEDLLLYKEVLGSDWSGFTWNFGITINKGTLRIDDVMEISFSGVID